MAGRAGGLRGGWALGAAALLWACAPAPPLGPGAYALRSVPRAAEGERPASAEGSVLGAIEVEEAGCGGGALRVRLAGPGFSTEGWAKAELLPPEAEGGGPDEGGGGAEAAGWLRFPMRWAIGRGDGLLRLDAGRARLPLGLRAGEHDLALQISPGAPEPAPLAAVEAEAGAALSAGAAAWAAGRFSLVGPAGEVVGDVDFFDDTGVMVALYDATWSTGWPRVAARADEGGEILLTVPVEPSLEGESALLMVNLATGYVVVPSAERPQPEDRWLRLVPGGPTEAERTAAFAAAAAEAEAAELEWLQAWAPRLAAHAWTPLGCRPVASVGEDWERMLRGYGLTIAPAVRGGCEVQLDPRPPQHRRRLRALANAEGLQWWAPAGG